MTDVPPATRPATTVAAAIVIFGAAVRPDGTPSMTLRRRVQAAALCGRRMPGVLYVPTGAVGRHGPSEAVVMRDLLAALGVAAADILLEETGTDTLASVRAVRRLLRSHAGVRVGAVYAATSAYHLPRCLALLRLAGLPARACRPPPHPAARSFRARWFWRLREGLALPYDAALLLFLRAIGRL